MLNLNEAISRIKSVGVHNVRIVPMQNESVIDGNHQIEVNESGAWTTIIAGIKRNIAEDLVRQATNKVILG